VTDPVISPCSFSLASSSACSSSSSWDFQRLSRSFAIRRLYIRSNCSSYSPCNFRMLSLFSFRVRYLSFLFLFRLCSFLLKLCRFLFLFFLSFARFTPLFLWDFQRLYLGVLSLGGSTYGATAPATQLVTFDYRMLSLFFFRVRYLSLSLPLVLSPPETVSLSFPFLSLFRLISSSSSWDFQRLSQSFVTRRIDIRSNCSSDSPCDFRMRSLFFFRVRYLSFLFQLCSFLLKLCRFLFLSFFLPLDLLSWSELFFVVSFFLLACNGINYWWRRY
jgi:hypothetical protein